MKYLVDSSANIGDIAIDAAVYQAIVRNGHNLEVIVGEGAADMLADSTFIDLVHTRGTSAVGKAADYWRATRGDWDVILITRLWPTRFKPISFMGRTAVRRSKIHMDPSLYARGAVLYRLSMLDGLIDDWRDPIETRIPYSPERMASARVAAGVGERESYLTVAPGAGKAVKLWGVANFAEVIEAVRSRFDRVVAVGSPDEAALCGELAERCGITSVAGKLGLADTCALVSGASQHMGNDSGLCHVAAGNGVRTLAVGGWEDGHYVPWRQSMLRGEVSEISVRQVCEALEGLGQSAG